MPGPRGPQRRREVDADEHPVGSPVGQRRDALDRRGGPDRALRRADRAPGRRALRLPGTLALPEPQHRRERPHRPPGAAGVRLAAPGRRPDAGCARPHLPGHGLSMADLVGDLSIGRRQMVEIARAFTETDEKARLVILDEPTSSLDASAADQLVAAARRFSAAGNSAIVISHKINEILAVADRIVVMKDGAVVDDRPRAGLHPRGHRRRHGPRGRARSAPPGPRRPPPRRSSRCRARSERQPALPRRPRRDRRPRGARRPRPDRPAARPSRRAGAARAIAGDVALVPGDRTTDGVFPLWSIERNMSARWLPHLRRRGLIDLGRERGRGRGPGASAWPSGRPTSGNPDPVAVRRQPAEGALRPRARRAGAASS